MSTKTQRVASFLTSNFGRDSKTMFFRDQTSNFVTKMMTSDCNDATVECKKDFFFFFFKYGKAILMNLPQTRQYLKREAVSRKQHNDVGWYMLLTPSFLHD